MRSFGLILMVLGVLGFFYCSSQLSQAPPLPEGLTPQEELREPGGRWEIGRYVAGGLGGFGLLMALFPKGR
jgi:hypothetical protein